MKEETFALYGDIIWCPDSETMEEAPESYLVVDEGKCAGVFKTLPEKYAGIPVSDYSGRLILPGLVDLHVHAPQYGYRGTGMDKELMEWLESYAFPEEARFGKEDYASYMYGQFAEDLKKSATTRAAVFASRHVPATEILMDQLEETGLKTYVGKVNMDRNAPDYLREADAAASLRDTEEWIKAVRERHYQHTKPILTPRFVPACSDELLAGLGELQRKYKLPVQSHLSENAGEVAFVHELCPNERFYGEVYEKYGLFGGEAKTIMAHCVLSTAEEIALMKMKGVCIAHCPQSNENIASGIAPVRHYLNEGLHVGLGSDIAGGSSLSIFRAMTDAIQVSKLRWRLVDDGLKPLNITEALYLATKGGGSFWGKTGSFEEGYEADILVLDDRRWRYRFEMSLRERIEKASYLSDERDLKAKYVAGRKIFGE